MSGFVLVGDSCWAKAVFDMGLQMIVNQKRPLRSDINIVGLSRMFFLGVSSRRGGTVDDGLCGCEIGKRRSGLLEDLEVSLTFGMDAGLGWDM